MNLDQLKLQRDLYKLLLTTNSFCNNDIESAINRALKMVIQITGARMGYIEMTDITGEKWWSTHQCTDEEILQIQKYVSSGIIREAFSLGDIVTTPAAFFDPRFKNRKSVQAEKIQAVLCAPVGQGTMQGVIYLQGDDSFQPGSEESLMEANFFSRHIAPLLKLLYTHRTRSKTTKPKNSDHELEGIIGNSPAFQSVLKEALTIALLDVTVLLTGETGTGKTQLAKAIHDNSKRRHGPFIQINCANLPETLVESELFGSVRGAFSGAYADTKGKIAAADDGTIFLDEIGELPLSAQSKLLQFLEHGCFYPLGSSHVVKPDVRIIAASNIDFEASIKNRTFRSDLFYRINIFSLELPSLQKRIPDIPELTKFFVEKYCSKFNIPAISIDGRLIETLQKFQWPGNIRQLENVLQQAVVRAYNESSLILTTEHVFHPLSDNEISYPRSGGTFMIEKERWEKEFIEYSLHENSWNVSLTAQRIGISRSYMNNLIKHHHLFRTENSKIKL